MSAVPSLCCVCVRQVCIRPNRCYACRQLVWDHTAKPVKTSCSCQMCECCDNSPLRHTAAETPEQWASHGQFLTSSMAKGRCEQQRSKWRKLPFEHFSCKGLPSLYTRVVASSRWAVWAPRGRQGACANSSTLTTTHVRGRWLNGENIYQY